MKKKVRIEETGGTLRLRWYCQGKRYSLSNGDRDNALGRGIAQHTAAQIVNDIESGYFDESLVKYRRRTIGPKPTEINIPELIREFAAFKLREGDIGQRSLETRYEPLAIALEKGLDIPCHKLNKAQAKDFAKYCDINLTPGTAKGRLWILQSAWRWGKGHFNFSVDNPWEGLTEAIKKKPQRSYKKPFSLKEIAAIKTSFKNSKYQDLVILLFSTAARPGELFGLRWMDVSEDFQTICIRNAVSRGVQTGRTKTGVDRQVPLTVTAGKVLSDRHEGQDPENLVFPGVNGTPIKDQSFRSAWRRHLAKAGIEYRCPRNIRPSVISHNRAKGVDPVALAEACGHSLRTQEEIYLKSVGNKTLFVEL